MPQPTSNRITLLSASRKAACPSKTVNSAKACAKVLRSIGAVSVGTNCWPLEVIWQPEGEGRFHTEELL